MYHLIAFINDLHIYLTSTNIGQGNTIRIHSKKLEDLGDLSFPLNIENWSQVIAPRHNLSTIFDYKSPNHDLKSQINCLLEESKKWSLIITSYNLKGKDLRLYLQRCPVTFLCINQVLSENCNYGFKDKYFEKKINLIGGSGVNEDSLHLTELRILKTQKIAQNFLDNLTLNLSQTDCNIKIITNSNAEQNLFLICGSILNEKGIKDIKTTAAELYAKRALDLQLMAQHKYGIQVKSSWGDFFQKLGKASVTIELLQNKLHKSCKITLNNVQCVNKGPAFIFYNCARINALLKQFESNISNGVYPELPAVDHINFALLNQKEEWDLVYVYILQFPIVLKKCVFDIKSGVLNIHYLITFLSNLSSTFSAYYRRVKILIISKQHLLPTLYARIYLIKAIQNVFHTSLYLLDIEPVKQM